MQKFTTIDSLAAKVLDWAEARNLLAGSTPIHQFAKLSSEMGELADNLLKNAPREKIADDIGDCMVVLTIIAKQNGLDLVHCLAAAYNDIKDRKGIMVDGVFIKETDPAYEYHVAQRNAVKEIASEG